MPVRALGGSDCEALHPGWLGQPVNAGSSLAYVASGVCALRRGGPVAPAAALSLVGAGSLLYHGPMPRGAGAFHDGSIAALVPTSAIVAVRRRRLPRPPSSALFALASGAAVNILTRTGAPLCRPSSWLQGHGAWHVLTAVAAGSWLGAWPPTRTP